MTTLHFYPLVALNSHYVVISCSWISTKRSVFCFVATRGLNFSVEELVQKLVGSRL